MPVMHQAAPAPARPRPWHGVAHYENFPVASWLVPAPLRPAVATLYRFARYADDVADEGDAPAAERLAELAALERALTDPQADHPLVRPLLPHLAALPEGRGDCRARRARSRSASARPAARNSSCGM